MQGAATFLASVSLCIGSFLKIYHIILSILFHFLIGAGLEADESHIERREAESDAVTSPQCQEFLENKGLSLLGYTVHNFMQSLGAFCV